MSELDSQASAIKHTRTSTESSLSDRRYTLIGDNANVVYAAVYNAGHVRCIGFMHSYLGEQELGQRWIILASCEHAVRSEEEL